MSQEAVDAAIAFLMQLDPATQREVLERYEEVLQVELDTTSRRLRRIASALHQAKRELGKSPSIREYKGLREAHRERGWPDPRSITRWLGVRSWNDALVRMRLEPVADGDVVGEAIGPVYTIDEVIRAVRDCAEDLQRTPTITDYLAWQRRPDVRARPGRRPAATWIFNRIFGGFGPARVAAGLVVGGPTAAHPTNLLLRSANYRLDDEQILEDIRFAASRIEGPVTATAYDRERRLIYDETKAQGHARALAGVGTVYRHFGTWTAAIQQAGLAERGWFAVPATLQRPRMPQTAQLPPPSAARPTHLILSPSKSRLDDEQILEDIRFVATRIEGPVTATAYNRERRRIYWETVAQGNPRALAGVGTVYRHFGTWTAAIGEAGVAERGWGAIGRTPLAGRNRAFADDDILAALSEAYDASDRTLTLSSYVVWRQEDAIRNPENRRLPPSYATVQRRFGGWSRAIRQMHEWRRTRGAT